MQLPEADPPASLDDLSPASLEAMLAAGREVLEWRRILAKSGDNLVGEVLRHEGPFYTLDHYPKGRRVRPREPQPVVLPRPLDRFEVRMSRPSWPVNRWLSCLLRLFRPQIGALLQERDERLRVWQREHPGVNAHEDRSLEVRLAAAGQRRGPDRAARAAPRPRGPG